MKVREIFDYLNTLCPVDTACDFDNVGILVGSPESDINRALISLDCTLETVRKATEKDCGLIITHHPVIFEPLKNVLEGSVVYELIRNGISVISMHTNLDIAKDGVGECLCKALDLREISSLAASDGYILKSGVISPVSAQSLAERIKAKLGGGVKYVDGGKPIEKILVCSGSGGGFIYDAVSLGFDAFIAAEIKHHQLLYAADSGISAFDAGHFNTEDIVIEPLVEILKERFNGVDFISFHSETIKYE